MNQTRERAPVPPLLMGPYLEPARGAVSNAEQHTLLPLSMWVEELSKGLDSGLRRRERLA